jgi:hypothetical protein
VISLLPVPGLALLMRVVQYLQRMFFLGQECLAHKRSLGQISDAINGKYNPIAFKQSLFKKIKTNDATLVLLNKLAQENNILIT